MLTDLFNILYIKMCDLHGKKSISLQFLALVVRLVAVDRVLVVVVLVGYAFDRLTVD